MDSFKKSWSTLDEIKVGVFLEESTQLNKTRSIEHGLVATTLSGIVESAQNAKNSKDFFDATCRLSLLFEGLTENSLKSVLEDTNLYVLLLNAVFRNSKFQEELIRVVEIEVSMHGRDADDLNVDSKKFLNSGISLAFFSIAAGLSILKDYNVIFLRKNLTDLVKFILKGISGKNTFTNLCFKLENISWDNRYHYKNKFPIKLSDEYLFGTLRTARSISGISFLSLTINSALANQFSKIAKITSSEGFSLSKVLSSVYGVIHRIEEGEKSYFEGFSEKTTHLLKDFFEIFIRNNERNLLFILKMISSDFHFQKEKKFFEIVLDKINNSTLLKKDLLSFSQENLRAFKGEIGEERYEWSNKVFIVSLRTLSVLSGISEAKDGKWKVSTAINELILWINDINDILNKYFIEDDWASIRDYLEQETTEVEWKSSFFTPMEQSFLNGEADASIGKRLFDKITKTILGMMNTSGGVLIVGLVENPEAIVRKELLKDIIYKNGKAFFDINSELKMVRKNLDQVRLQIFESLKNTTDSSPEKFNNLVALEPILLRDNQSSVTAIKISIKKSEKRFYNVEKKGDSKTWISLTMRAHGQTVSVDVRDYI